MFYNYNIYIIIYFIIIILYIYVCFITIIYNYTFLFVKGKPLPFACPFLLLEFCLVEKCLKARLGSTDVNLVAWHNCLMLWKTS